MDSKVVDSGLFRNGLPAKQRDIRRAVAVGSADLYNSSSISSVKEWWRAGAFASPIEARGAFKLAYQQALDGMGTSVEQWMGLNDSEMAEFRSPSGKLPCDVFMPSDGSSRVYFLRDPGDVVEKACVKIGTSTDVSARVSGGQTMNPRELFLIGSVPGDRELEADLHRKFRYLHVRGEWFEATTELLSFIDGLLYVTGGRCL
jgi:T5orf172 domain